MDQILKRPTEPVDTASSSACRIIGVNRIVVLVIPFIEFI
jgi:hypothetical protein